MHSETWVLTNARLADVARAELRLEDGRIAAIGSGVSRDGAQVEDCAGRLLTPALIDCHTHLVYAGNRAREFEMRLNGATYAEIAAAGRYRFHHAGGARSLGRRTGRGHPAAP